ncbi:DNA-(apurinic or apyrimidinic site) endonuclease 2 isoform X2 [Cryptomeria japonica]|uniref:DNA-(apurinic or apyrimidinic site) endonuclease 2 isoform X2 n=1 Tax=Cryptomeria japonica TaxID=3369 RepID=UPI0025ACD3A8|nr:DNA-(apurinic or apyrimidinic site) endonuclease 2 isoform X2 [Cryptomeria japonica]
MPPGVATFCKVNKAFSSTEVTLPLAVEEGFTGLVNCARLGETNAAVSGISNYEVEKGPEGLTRQELLKLDSEGRCIITDHGHFVLFNIYGPFAASDDSERFQFKLYFFKVLQRRFQAFLGQGRRVIIAGDLNIAPFSIDSCDPGPHFEENMCRKWLRMLLNDGGPFTDAFRKFHPYRKEAYTCWAQVTGAEEFNYGTRIDLILVAGPCLHQEANSKRHNFINCHIEECDILSYFKRNKPDKTPKWQGGRSLKLEGSDHAPVYITISEMPDVAIHDVPALAARYMPELSGRQQSILSLLQKRQVAEIGLSVVSDFSSRKKCREKSSEREINVSADESKKPEVPLCNMSATDYCEPSLALIQQPSSEFSEENKFFKNHCLSVSKDSLKSAWFDCIEAKRKQLPMNQNRQTVRQKKKNESEARQCTLWSFFPVNSTKASKDSSYMICEEVYKSETDQNTQRGNIVSETETAEMKELNLPTDQSGIQHSQYNMNCNQDGEKDKISVSKSVWEEEKTAQYLEPIILGGKDKVKTAALEWQKIQNLMTSSVPLCEGHGEPCVARVVKKAGPNIGRGFYVCARAKGPESNPETRCKHFEWSSMKGKSKGR